jgi:hypothetical protein
MAEAETDPTRSDDAASKASSPWLLLEDIFQRWRVRLKSSQEAVSELEALLCDRETRSRKRRVDTSGEEIPDTLTFLNAQFWQDYGALLSVVPDADGVGDRLRIGTIAALVGMIDYTDYADIYWDDYSPGWRWEFSVRRLDAERWEHLYPELAAPPLNKEPTSASAPSEELSNKPRQKPGPKPDFDWEMIGAKCYDLMDYHGEFDTSDPEWDCQARLEEALMKFCQDTWKREPGPSTLRERLPAWLSTWRERKIGAA